MHCIATTQEGEDYERHVSLHNDASEAKYILVIHLPLSDYLAPYELQTAKQSYKGKN